MWAHVDWQSHSTLSGHSNSHGHLDDTVFTGEIISLWMWTRRRGQRLGFRRYEYTINVEMLEETIQGPLLGLYIPAWTNHHAATSWNNKGQLISFSSLCHKSVKREGRKLGGRQEGGEDEEYKSTRVGISDNLCNLGNWLRLFVKAFNVLSQFMPHTYKGYLAKPLPLFNLKWSAGSNPLFIHTLSKGRKLHVSSGGWRGAPCRKITARRPTRTSQQQACINFVIK